MMKNLFLGGIVILMAAMAILFLEVAVDKDVKSTLNDTLNNSHGNIIQTNADRSDTAVVRIYPTEWRVDDTLWPARWSRD